MIKQFEISDRDDIISGKVSVFTEHGEPVEIVKWDCKGKYPILACIFDGDTDDACFYDLSGVSATGSKLMVKDNNLRDWKYVIHAILTRWLGIGQYLDDPKTEDIAKYLQERFGSLIKQTPKDKECCEELIQYIEGRINDGTTGQPVWMKWKNWLELINDKLCM